MRIQPVRTEAEHDAAVARITQLLGAELGTAASDELEVLLARPGLQEILESLTDHALGCGTREFLKPVDFVEIGLNELLGHGGDPKNAIRPTMPAWQSG